MQVKYHAWLAVYFAISIPFLFFLFYHISTPLVYSTLSRNIIVQAQTTAQIITRYRALIINPNFIMPSKIQLDENLWFLYICLQKSDMTSVSPSRLCLPTLSLFPNLLTRILDRLQRRQPRNLPQAPSSTNALHPITSSNRIWNTDRHSWTTFRLSFLQL